MATRAWDHDGDIVEGPSGVTRASVKYFGTGQTGSDAIAEVKVSQSLNIGDPHPVHEAPLLLSSLSVGRKLGAGTDTRFEVFANYTAEGVDFSFPPPDKGDPAYNSNESSFGTREIDIPLISGRIVTIGQWDNSVGPPPAGTLVNTIEFDVREHRVSVGNQTYKHEINRIGLQGSGAWDAFRSAIAKQVDKLHTLNGDIYRFIGANVRQVDRPTVFRVTYTWEFDPGNPALPSSAFGGDSLFPIPARAPFEEYVIRWETVPPATIPITLLGDADILPPRVPFVDVFQPYALDPAGWQTLPGL